MNSTDHTPDAENREKRIEEVLKMIGGLEESIRMALDNGDKEFVATLKPLKAKYYDKLRRVVYGLPEERSVSTEKNS